MPDALGERVFVVNVCGLALGATAAVVIRLLNRYLHRTKLAYDDLFVTGALVPLWGLAGTGILSTCRPLTFQIVPLNIDNQFFARADLASLRRFCLQVSTTSSTERYSPAIFCT